MNARATSPDAAGTGRADRPPVPAAFLAMGWSDRAACRDVDGDIFFPLGEDESWIDLALCAETDPEIFYPEKGGSSAQAKAVCRACEVRAECLEYALEHSERFGIWGGLSERERRVLRRGPDQHWSAA